MIILYGFSQLIDLPDRVIDGLCLLLFAVENAVVQVACAHLQQRFGGAARIAVDDGMAERKARKVFGDSLNGGRPRRRSGCDACGAYRNDGDQCKHACDDLGFDFLIFHCIIVIVCVGLVDGCELVHLFHGTYSFLYSIELIFCRGRLPLFFVFPVEPRLLCFP